MNAKSQRQNTKQTNKGMLKLFSMCMNIISSESRSHVINLNNKKKSKILLVNHQKVWPLMTDNVFI